MPSALQNLLNLRDLAKGNVAEQENKIPPLNIPSKEKDCRLREWGTVDFNDLTLHSRLKSSRSLSPSQILAKRSMKNQFKSDANKSFSSNDESPACSSYGSSSILSTHGTSFDRVFWDYHESPKAPIRAFQIQRSSSPELGEFGKNVVIDGGPIMTDDSTTLSDNMSKSSVGGDSETNLSVKSKKEKHVEQLKKIMDSYNCMVCRPPFEENDEVGDRSQWPDALQLVPATETELGGATKTGVLMQSM